MPIRNLKRIRAVQPGSADPRRLRILTWAAPFVFVTIAVRAVVIHLSPPGATQLQHIAQRQYSESIKLAPYRGTILDHRQEPLAMSIRLPSIYINPRVFRPQDAELQKIARLLHVSPATVRDAMKKSGYFAWIKRRIPVSVSKEILGMEIDGLSSITEPARYYPAGRAASQLLGMVGIDDHGLAGLEKLFDSQLQGEETELTPYTDARGRTIFDNPALVSPEKSGATIILTLDRAIQEIAEETLAKGVHNARAKSGSLVALDPHTGRVLAVANSPSFDPNDRTNLKLENSRNFAFLDTFEPGSVIKPFVIASAMEKHLTAPEAIHDCEKGFFRSGSIRIRDDHGKDKLTTTEVLIHSSNICTFKIASTLGRDGLFASLQKFGFGANSMDLQFPGLTLGRLAQPDLWSPARFANVAFGQGMTASALQVAQGYAALANGGKFIQPFLVDRIENGDGVVLRSFPAPPSKQVLNPETASSIRGMLQRVVTEGTGKNAKSFYYSTAGKTGTSQKVDSQTRTYSKTKRVASFAGFSPVADPRMVVYVVIDEPEEKPYYGGTWAAPVFREFIDRSLQYLNVPPDVDISSADRQKLARVGKRDNETVED